MSVANVAGLVSGFLSPALSFFSIGPTRSFNGISGYVTISENTVDAIEITQQPVQQGASIADHFFKKPVTLSIQIQFGNTASLLNGFGLFGGQSLTQVYQSLLTLQTNGVPFTVNTLKRSYPNMLLATLGQTTDKRTENCLSITASFQEVIIVPIGTATLNPAQLKTPGLNSSTQNVGKKSALFTLFGPQT